MAAKNTHEIKNYIISRYKEKTKTSRSHDSNAKNYLPGGDTRTTTYFEPYPVYMQKGQGHFLYDDDGNQYLDMVNNYTSLIHGHAHPKTVEAARDQLERGSILGAAAEIHYVHARHLIQRMPFLETVRYCNSGTEATLFAIRAARAFTGKDGIIKMDGGYHGSHDIAEVNLNPDIKTEGLPRVNVEPGVATSQLSDVHVAPFNDLEALDAILKTHAKTSAAIILEPMMGAGGMIPPLPGYLKGVRELADRYKVLLILDEVLTFRLSAGGLQQTEGVRPDLSALGKIIGGGFPVGAFGGRKDIMALFDPTYPNALMHGGTFNGCNITLAAGLATLEAYGQAEAERLNSLGGRLKIGFSRVLKEHGINGCISGIGSLNQVHLTPDPPVNAKESAICRFKFSEIFRLLHIELMNRGIYSAPARSMFILSTPMTGAEIDIAIKTFQETVELLKPYIAHTAPDLITQ